MATPTSNTVLVSDVGFPLDEHTASLIAGVKWGGAVGTGVTLTYSFPEGGDTAYDPVSYPPDNPFLNEWIFGNGWTPLNGTQQANFIDALDVWANVADIVFDPLDDNGSEVGEIRVAFSELVDAEGAGAWAYLPDTGPYAGDIWVNHFYTAENFDEGSWHFNTLVHEIGHALGLKHPFDTDGSEVVLPAEFDNIFYTVMTYTDDPSGNEFFIDRYPTTPMVIDIQSIQYLYGINDTFHAGDDTYTYDGNGLYFETIWDAGGTDTIVHDGTNGAVIDLRPGAWSGLGLPIEFSRLNGSLAYTDPRTVWIAFGTDIEIAIGGSGDDEIYGNDLDNVLYGGGGDDLLNGGSGNDLLYAGSGSDTAAYFDASSGVTVNLDVAGAQNTGGGGVDTLLDFENLTGSGSNDLLIGAAGANILSGRGSNDVIHGGAGNDTLLGGAGDDDLYGGEGIDTADFGDATAGVTVTGLQDATGHGADELEGFENLTGSAFGDDLEGDGGNNVIRAQTGNDIATGGAGNDILYGGNGTDSLHGGAGNDVLWGEGGADTLEGGTGTDVLRGGAGNDRYLLDADDIAIETGGGGTDTLVVSWTFTLPGEFEILELADSADINGTGNAVANTLQGNAGANVLDGLGGNDRLLGGAGNDTLVFDAADTLLTDGGAGTDNLALATGLTLDLQGRAGTQLVGIEIISLGGAGTLTFDSAQVLALGGSLVVRGDGTDSVVAEGSWEYLGLESLAGIDYEHYAFSGATTLIQLGVNVEISLDESDADDPGEPDEAPLTVDGGAYGDTLDGSAFADFLRGLDGDDLVNGGAGDDKLLGNGGADTLHGAAGNDLLKGGGGNDTLNGGAGDDTLKGGGGIDVLDGGAGSDNYVLAAGDFTPDTFQDSGTGINDVDEIDASKTEELHLGTVFSHAGNNMELITGADTGTRIVDGDGPVTWDFTGVTLENITSLDGTSADDVISGSAGNDKVRGRGGADQLDGGAGKDTLLGQGGNDVLSGGAGKDVLTGGKGADVFVFATALDVARADTITDFNPGADLLQLDVEIFTSLSTLPGNALDAAEFQAGGDSAALDADVRIVYNTTTGALYYDADGIGDGAAVKIAVLAGAPVLTADDITVISS